MAPDKRHTQAMIRSSCRGDGTFRATAFAVASFLLLSTASCGSNTASSAPASSSKAGAEAGASKGDAGAPALGIVDGFDCSDLSNLNTKVFPSSDEMWSALQNMVNMGPRHDGSDGDHKWTDYLHQRMIDMGLQSITRDTIMVQGTNGLSGAGAPTSGTADHLAGILPGMSTDIIVLGVHSDGPNSIEENGAAILTEVMQYLTQIPARCRRHTFALVLASCHMATCSNGDVPGWAGLHADIMSKTIAFLAPEHAGMKYRPGNGNGPIAQAFLCTTKSLQSLCAQFISDLKITPGMLTKPGEELGSSAAWDALSNKQKPVIGSMAYWDSLNNGLTTTGIGTEGIDQDIFYKVTQFYAKMAGALDGQFDKLKQ
jgi:hypothetical protein